jgi:hypothetical protein
LRFRLDIHAKMRTALMAKFTRKVIYGRKEIKPRSSIKRPGKGAGS